MYNTHARTHTEGDGMGGRDVSQFLPAYITLGIHSYSSDCIFTHMYATAMNIIDSYMLLKKGKAALLHSWTVFCMEVSLCQNMRNCLLWYNASVFQLHICNLWSQEEENVRT